MSTSRVGERPDRGAHRLARDRRQIALDVDDHVVPAVRIDRRQRLEDAVGAGAVIGPGQRRPAAGGRHRLDDALIVGGDQHRPDVGLDRAAPNMDDHRFAPDVGERLAGQPRRAHAGGDENDRIGHGGYEKRAQKLGSAPRLYVLPRQTQSG